MEQKVVKLIEEADWTFANSYKDFAPHEYANRKDNPELFNLIDFLLIRKGEEEKFYFPQGSKEYTYIYIGEHKYWYTNKGLILNRCDKKQNASYGVEKEEAETPD